MTLRKALRSIVEGLAPVAVTLGVCQAIGYAIASFMGPVLPGSTVGVALLSGVALFILTIVTDFLREQACRREHFDREAAKVLGVQRFAQVSGATIIVRPATTRTLQVSAPPGGRIQRWLSLFLPRKMFEMVVAQAIADMREECYEALARHDTTAYRCVLVRGHLSIILAVGFWMWFAVGRRLVAIWKAVS